MQKLEINTPQNVTISYSLASIGYRILASVFDYAIILSYLFFCFKLISHDNLNNLDNWTINAIYSLMLIPVFLYSFLMELIFKGQSIGKKIMKIKVVKIDGSRATIWDYFIRLVLRLVDIWMFGAVASVLSIIISKKSQRLGDLAADTTVIKTIPNFSLSKTLSHEPKETYKIKYPEVMNLNDKDINIIKLHYDKGNKRNRALNHKKVGQRIEKVLNIKHKENSYTEFIETILKDYYQRFKDD